MNHETATDLKALGIVVVAIAVCTWLCFAARTSEGPMPEQEQQQPQFKYQLGSKVRCRITGFEGIVMGQHRYLYGCLTYSVKPAELKDGKPIDSVGFDEGQLELVPGEPLPHAPIETGGPCPAIPPVSR